MMHFMLRAAQQWFAITGSGLRPVADWPHIDAPAIVLVAPLRCDTAIMEVEGRRQHLVSLVEHRLSTAGALYGSTQVSIHHASRKGRTFRVLYSAAADDEVDAVSRWAGEQPEPVLCVSLLTWIWHGLRESDAMVCQVGTTTFFLARINGKAIHASAVAFSESMGDLKGSWELLAGRIRAALTRDVPDSLRNSLRVRWAPVCARRDKGWTMARERALAEDVLAASGAALQMPEHGVCVEDGDCTLVSALPGWMGPGAMACAQGGLLGKARWAAAAWIGRWMPAAWLQCGLVVALAIFMHWRADTLREQARLDSAQTMRLTHETAALQAGAAMPAGYDEWVQQITSQYRALAGIDLNRVIRDVGAAGNVAGVSVVRLHTVKPPQQAHTLARDNQSSSGAPASPALEVEGLVSEDAGAQVTSQLARFVGELRHRGYVVVPVNTATTPGTRELSSRLFAYRLEQSATGGARS